jgi:hypothetical protein
VNIYDQCLQAFFDNERFSNEVLHSRRRMQAVFDIIALATVDGSDDQGASKSGSANPSS